MLLYECMNLIIIIILNIMCVVLVKNFNRDFLFLVRNEWSYLQTGWNTVFRTGHSVPTQGGERPWACSRSFNRWQTMWEGLWTILPLYLREGETFMTKCEVYKSMYMVLWPELSQNKRYWLIMRLVSVHFMQISILQILRNGQCCNWTYRK